MPFNNPYMEGIDWGSGIQDIGYQLMLMRMLQQMMGPKEKTTESLKTTGVPPGAAGRSLQMGAQPQPGGYPMQRTPPIPGAQSGGQQMDPQMMMLLQMLLQQRPQQAIRG